ncbi:hypothetical protein CB0940_08108 [Cercospora beticola]|uniref:F-box domain-containing protein n=1 Tax=Cercospora beticola TaxID=122368 RepID=A0A2G5HPI9_CERBT|nr:hypothetical protein CB0940_08108 [Cercospora beticola]PIA94454.1 hypothetical protein CB0940_08108 [Cercospora beticola]WPB04675.1 hypothetical protein RHO25_009321 [Cercospora beticola]
MPDFWDLPRNVRDKIYRMHLVHDEAIDSEKHYDMCRVYYPPYSSEYMPALLRLSDRADREAAPIYFGENCFKFPSLSTGNIMFSLDKRHARLVKRIDCDWDPAATLTGFFFDQIASIKGLQELNLRVDEQAMVHSALCKRDIRQRYRLKDTFSAQEQLAIYRFPGMCSLVSLRGIPTVNFMKRTNPADKTKDFGGPIPGGVLLTQVAPLIARPAVKAKTKKASKGKRNTKKRSNDSYFDFLSLPPELRNRIYDLLLRIDGPIHPSKKPPSTKPKSCSSTQGYESALSLLGVNKQIRDEAVGIYYANPLVFYYPTQFHAFMVDLGVLRRSVITDVTIHYDNTKRGGIDLVDLSFPLLRDLTGLKRLQITMQNTLFNKIYIRGWMNRWRMDNANPSCIPGMKMLFSLRGIVDIKVRDIELEEAYQKAVEDKVYPNFDPHSRSYHVLKLTAALSHFNEALKLAQKGAINEELLQDNKWHTWDDFPELPEEEESDEEDEADEDESMDEQQDVTNHVEAGPSDGNNMPIIIAPGHAPAPGPRRSARLSAKAAEVISAQEDDAEDMEVDNYDGGRGASPEL